MDSIKPFHCRVTLVVVVYHRHWKGIVSIPFPVSQEPEEEGPKQEEEGEREGGGERLICGQCYSLSTSGVKENHRVSKEFMAEDDLCILWADTV